MFFCYDNRCSSLHNENVLKTNIQSLTLATVSMNDENE